MAEDKKKSLPTPEAAAAKSASDLIPNRKAMSLAALGESVSTKSAQR
jgi:hypothetical protein